MKEGEQVNKDLILTKNERKLLQDIDSVSLPSLTRAISGLSDEELIGLYKRITDIKVYSWGLNCLIAYEAHYNRGISFIEIAKAFNTTRQTCWREAEIWNKIISKAPELLDDPFLSKSWFKRVIEYESEEPIKELTRISDLREKIYYENITRQQQGLPKIKYSTRDYLGETKGGKYVCDVCNERIDVYKKICELCLEKLEEVK